MLDVTTPVRHSRNGRLPLYVLPITGCLNGISDELARDPYMNHSPHGVDFLGCRVMPDHVLLSRRSRERFARKMASLESAYLAGEVDELELQERATSLCAFTQAAGAKSWHFRSRVLQRPMSKARARPLFFWTAALCLVAHFGRVYEIRADERHERNQKVAPKRKRPR